MSPLMRGCLGVIPGIVVLSVIGWAPANGRTSEEESNPTMASSERQNRVTVDYEITGLPVYQNDGPNLWSIDATVLIVALKASVEPGSWDETTLVRQKRHALMVTHSPAVQRKVEKFLQGHSRVGSPLDPEQHVNPVFE